MKLKYEKPLAAVDLYQFTQAISACITKIGLLNSQCVYSDIDAPVEMRSLALNNWFTEGNCIVTANNGKTSDGTCYHTNSNATFAS